MHWISQALSERYAIILPLHRECCPEGAARSTPTDQCFYYPRSDRTQSAGRIRFFSSVVSVDDGSVENITGSPRVPSKAESRNVRRIMRRTLLCQTHDEDRGT